jgi:hypothetical protein
LSAICPLRPALSLAPSSGSNPTAFQAVSFEPTFTRIVGWQSIDEAHTRFAQPDWKAFQFTTAEGGNVSRQELESVATLLDERTYRQEFEASFENLGVGRAYYACDRVNSVRDVGFNHQSALCWSLDFNMNPLCSVLAQFNKVQVQILDETIQPDSNTLQACEEFLSRTEKWRSGVPLNVYVYGDAACNLRRPVNY